MKLFQQVATDAAIKIVTPSDGAEADVTPVDATPSAGDARAASRARRRRAGAGVSNPMSRGTRRE